MKKLRKVSLNGTGDLHDSSSSARKKAESEELSRKLSNNCKTHVSQVEVKNILSMNNNDVKPLSQCSKVPAILNNSVDSDEEHTGSEVSEVSLLIEEPDDLTNSQSNSVSHDLSDVNEQHSKSDSESPKPKAKKNCKLHKSESFGPIRLRKTGGEILLSRYHKVGFDLGVLLKYCIVIKICKF